MAKVLNALVFFFIFIQSLLLGSGFQAHARRYVHSYTPQCRRRPWRPLYEGGIVVNPELDQGLLGWEAFGDAKIEHREFDGNKYIVASSRNRSFHSFKQTFYLEKKKYYTVSAWVQVSNSRADVAAVFKTRAGYEIAGWVTAQEGCWSMLKGGLVVNVSGPAHFYFESQNLEAEIMADSISLQPFTRRQWTAHQRYNVEKARKTPVKFQVLDQLGRPVPNATVSLTQKHAKFPFGCAINQNILYNRAYQKWFLKRFSYTVFENELKWYSTENSPGQPDYSIADRLVQFAKSHKKKIRGHNVLWDNENDQPYWVKGLWNGLGDAANKRINSVMSRYKGQFFQWDVMNENMHGQYFENRLGYGISATFYKMASQIDSRATMFLNEYNTIEDSRDPNAAPWKYLQKIKEVKSSCIKRPGIGLEGHFTYANLPYIRSTLDVLAAARSPIWITELDVAPGPAQVFFLDQILRELHSHPNVDGIVLWSAISPPGNCYVMCLTDYNFNNLPTGNVVDNFISQLTHAEDLPGTTDSDGIYKGSFYHGQYEVNVNHASGLSSTRTIYVAPREEVPCGRHTFSINI